VSQSLVELTARLEADVPAQDDSPTPTQYETAVLDAVHAFNELYGVNRLHEFATVPGQADYALPADFSQIIRLEPLLVSGAVAITPDALIPMPQDGLRETVMVRGLTLSLYPAPAYSITRRLWYRAVHVLEEETAVFPYLTPAEVSVIMLKAQANAWRLICGRVSRSEGWKYQMGDVMIDKTKVGEALSGWVGRLDGEFEERVKRLRGPVGGLR
jgi:hypothetical protein